jgi:hypothetical protein
MTPMYYTCPKCGKTYLLQQGETVTCCGIEFTWDEDKIFIDPDEENFTW